MNEMNPFFLHPVGKDYLWGGNHLHTQFGKKIPMNPLAETWECSTHPDGCSIVASGMFQGQTLKSVLQEHPDFLGKHANPDGSLPVLMKLIDAEKDLSVQVHPDDAYAKKYENGQNGKTEMWYILEATPGATLIYGFSHTLSPEQLEQHLKDETILSDLQKVPVQKGDTILIPAGTVHAIGAGIILAEIQQSSNLTYRLYDYNRTDVNGNKRPLHIEKAKAVAKLSATLPPETKQPPCQRIGYTLQCLCQCAYFCTTLLQIQNTCNLKEVQPASNTFQVLLCTEGTGTIQTADLEQPFRKGDCIFIPANCPDSILIGNAEWLHITC